MPCFIVSATYTAKDHDEKIFPKLYALIQRKVEVNPTYRFSLQLAAAWNFSEIKSTFKRLSYRLFIAQWHSYCLLNDDCYSYLCFNTITNKNHVKEISNTLTKKLSQLIKRSSYF